MGGVDLNDMMASFNNDNRKSVKMWKKLVFNIFHRLMINAHILYAKNSDDRSLKSRLQFTESIVDALAAEYQNIQEVPGGNRLQKLANNKLKECTVCSQRRQGQRHRTRYQCRYCANGVHPGCLRRHSVACREL